MGSYPCPICGANHHGDEECDFSRQTCRVCGCTDEMACTGGCAWVEDPEQKGDLCSRCLERFVRSDPARIR